jgi:hypothetical protein
MLASLNYVFTMAYDLDYCPFCNTRARGASARSMINRHIKNAAEKPPENRHPNDTHPSGTKLEERYVEVAQRRGFYSWANEPHERTAHHAEVQRRTADKRRAQDLIKVQTAFEALKYDSSFIIYFY